MSHSEKFFTDSLLITIFNQTFNYFFGWWLLGPCSTYGPGIKATCSTTLIPPFHDQKKNLPPFGLQLTSKHYLSFRPKKKSKHYLVRLLIGQQI